MHNRKQNKPQKDLIHKFPSGFIFSISMQSPEFGDCIGVESSADLKSDVDSPPPRRIRRTVSAPPDRNYPPPISWLARTENHFSHMPWVMKKYYSGDGRLIIKEERVEHHEYFLADRSNGRLVLNVVHFDDMCDQCHRPMEETSIPDEKIDGEDERIGDPTKDDVAAECCKYKGMVVNPCGGLVGTAAPVFRPPVQT